MNAPTRHLLHLAPLALALARPALAAEPTEECRRPLSTADLAALDSVADGRLYLEEIGPGAVGCLADRLVRTKDAKTRAAFRAYIQNDVWEAVRERLRALEGDGALPAEIRERIADLRATDYTDDPLNVGASAQYRFDNRRTVTADDTGAERFVAQTQTVRLSATGEGRFDVGKWKIAPALTAFGDALWSADRLYPVAAPSDADDGSSLGAGGDASLKVLRRDERASLSAHGSYSAYRDAPPERAEGSYGAGGTAQVRQIGGSAFDLQASGKWYVDDMAPLSVDYFDPYHEELVLHGEAAYMWTAAGLLATYDHEYYHDDSTVFRNRNTSDAGSAVLHLCARDDSYARIAFGGGAFGERYQSLGDVVVRSSGGEIHAIASGDLRLTRALRLDFELTFRANDLHGTFEGWYPSGQLDAGVTLELADLRVRLGAEAGGERRDLNHQQESFWTAAIADATYAPVDDFNLVASGAWQIFRQYDYYAFDDTYWRAGASVGLRLSRTLDVWLWTEGKLAAERYDDGDVAQDVSTAMILERLSIKI
jgi:hypothetical protein